MATLWAWATPASDRDSPVDHTWVTDYDNRGDAPPRDIAAVIRASGNYWYCWGAFHAQSDSALAQGLLGSETASAPVARCLCASNAPSAPDQGTSGTIRFYGIDGVCHQLANQLLWATASHAQPGLTVASARGYGVSAFFYGTYGLRYQAWADVRHACSRQTPASSNGVSKAASPSPSDDEFAEKAAAILSGRAADNKLPALLALRRQAQEKLLSAADQPNPTAGALNEMHRFFLGRAATLLDAAEFIDIFGIRTSDIANVALVDSEMFERVRSAK